MTTLQGRLEEVMRAMSWTHADVVRVSQQSSSVVSQWLGKGSKEIKSIGQIEAAIRLSDASGFATLWIAKGVGPKHLPKPLSSPGLHAHEPAAAYAAPSRVLGELQAMLKSVPTEMRGAVADLLAGMARDGGDEGRRQVLVQIFQAAQDKQQRAA